MDKYSKADVWSLPNGDGTEKEQSSPDIQELV